MPHRMIWNCWAARLGFKTFFDIHKFFHLNLTILNCVVVKAQTHTYVYLKPNKKELHFGTYVKMM